MITIPASNTQSKQLQLKLAAMLVTECLEKTTYTLDGDHLELLPMYNEQESLRKRGRQMLARALMVFPNLDAALRNHVALKPDVILQKVML